MAGACPWLRELTGMLLGALGCVPHCSGLEQLLHPSVLTRSTAVVMLSPLSGGAGSCRC